MLPVAVIVGCGGYRGVMIISVAVLQGIPLLGKAPQLGVDAPIDRIRWIPRVGTTLAGCYTGKDG